jgi:hypothetical protein
MMEFALAWIATQQFQNGCLPSGPGGMAKLRCCCRALIYVNAADFS